MSDDELFSEDDLQDMGKIEAEALAGLADKSAFWAIMPDADEPERLIRVAAYCLARIDGGREAVEQALSATNAYASEIDRAETAQARKLLARISDAMPDTEDDAT